VTVKNGNTTLTQNTHYTVAYSNNTNVGTATVTVTGIGDYTGTKSVNFTIAEKPKTNISDCTVKLARYSYYYDGKNKTPAVTVTYNGSTLSENEDYVVDYSNNRNIGTATATIKGMGNYTGEKTVNYTISEMPKIDIFSCKVVLSQTSFNYDGNAKKPDVTVTNGSQTLKKGTDYTVSYSNNINIGTASVSVTGIGDYSGVKTVNFNITEPEKMNISEKCTMSLSQLSYVYDGEEKSPDVIVKHETETLTRGVDYLVSYSNNIEPGTATVTVKGIGSYKGSKNLTFTITESKFVKEKFVIGEDNWNFINNTNLGDFSTGTYRSQMSEKYLNVLKNNLTPSEYQKVFVGSEVAPARLDKTWRGACHGMSVTMLLAKNGYLPYEDYQDGAENLHDLGRPTSNRDVSSLVLYYHMLQRKASSQQQFFSIPKNGHEANIKEILSLLDSNNAVVVGYTQESFGGHSVLAYDYEYGSFKTGGVTYNLRIKICDPNTSNIDDENHYIYVNIVTFSWEVPAYQQVSSANGARFNFISADLGVVNDGGYLSGENQNDTANYVARLDAFTIGEKRSVSKVLLGEKGEYDYDNNSAGDIEEDFSYVLNGEVEMTAGYNLYDENAAYRISQSQPTEMGVGITYENCTMTGGTKAGESVLFDKNGYVEVRGESAQYNMSITMDGDHPTDWFTIAVSGQGADCAKLQQVENGWVVSADSLSNVEVTVNNKDDMAHTSFSTEYTTALIYEIDKDTIGIAVDMDDNGTYESTIETTTEKMDPDNIANNDITTDTDTGTDTDTS
ncbi:MAG: hypothetical protein IIY78_09985, partial [Clostridia bacterium]|nr:hypothetical protein [Clostridia bacterium]